MGGRILEMSDHVLKDQLWAEVRREDTENMKINTPPESGSTDYRDQEFVNGESGRGQERNLRGTEWEMRVCRLGNSLDIPGTTSPASQAEGKAEARQPG